MKDITGLQIGKFFVIKKVFNPKVKTMQNKYWLVEVNGKQKIMRYDNILTFGKYKEKQLNHVKESLISPKEVILKQIQSNDDIGLGAVMLCCSMDIMNKYEELKRQNPRFYFSSLHHFIEDYMNTPRYKSVVLNKSK